MIPYAYLMAWSAIHCKELMTCGADADKEGLPTICKFEGRWWKYQYIEKARKAVDRNNAYRF